MDYSERYAYWLSNADEVTRCELEKIKGDDKEIYDRFYKEAEFGTGGMRGLIGAGRNRINKYTVARATRGYAEYIKKQGEDAARRGVVIAYDNRRLSLELALTTAGVLAKEGIQAYLFDSLRTTPELSFAVRYLKAFGGVVITASHNPPEYNGYKLYDESGCQLVPSQVEPVINEIGKIKDELSVDCLTRDEAGELIKTVGCEIDEAYYEEVLKLLFDKNEKRNTKIVYTPQHGTGNIPVRRVLVEAGFEIIPVESQCFPNEDFINTKNPNPEAPDAYGEAIKIMKKTEADIAIATDPDCDRLGAVINMKNGEHRLLTGNQSGAILLYYLLNRMKECGRLPSNAVMLNTVVTSTLGDRIAEDFGITVEKTLTGFKFIGERIREHELKGDKSFVFGYEESYGCLIGDFVRDKDAVQASLLFAEATDYYKKQGKTLIDVLEEIFGKYGYFADSLVSITLKGEDGAKRIEKIIEDLRKEPFSEIGGCKVKELIDFEKDVEGFIKSNVLLYSFADGSFVAVRPSGTEPKCKFYYCARANTKTEAEDKIGKFKTAFEIKN